MKGALIILLATAAIGLILWFIDRRTKPAADTPVFDDDTSEDDQCCGLHENCEKKLLTPTHNDIEYFDDDELDAFIGRQPDTYTEAETDQFRDILLTLPEDEIPAWTVSLQLRGIPLPPPIRNEILLIVSEQRTQELVR